MKKTEIVAIYKSAEVFIAHTHQCCQVAYCTFKVAAELVPSVPKRAALLRALGADTCKLLSRAMDAVGRPSPPVYDASAAGARLGPALAGVRALMDEFQRSGFVRGYTLDTEDFEEVRLSTTDQRRLL